MDMSRKNTSSNSYSDITCSGEDYNGVACGGDNGDPGEDNLV